MFKNTLFTLGVAALVAPAMAADENWTTDLDAALKQAGQEGKYVMIDFNGSDWCGPCMALKAHVLDTPEFLEYAKEKLILVDIDLPKQKQMDPKLMRTNRSLANEFEVSGYPTILLLNPDGYVLGGFSGVRSNVKEVTNLFDAAIAHQAKYAAAAALEGSAKAKALFDAHKAIKPLTNPRLIDAAVAVDTEDVLGMRAEWEAKAKAKAREADVMAKIEAVKRDPKALLEVVSSELEAGEMPQELRANLLKFKGEIMISLSENMDDLMAAKAVLMEFAASSGNKEALVKGQVEKMFENPEAFLQQVIQSRAGQGNK